MITYATEADTELAFNQIMSRCQGFRVLKEVEGYMLHPMPGQNPQTVRIDRVLLPYANVVEGGWIDGAIGVELKRSDLSIGKTICQCLDYRRSAFRLDTGHFIVLDQVFIFPLERQIGDIESIMEQHRIGTMEPRGVGGFSFKMGVQHVLAWDAGKPFLCKPKCNGRKAGNRG